MFTCVTRGSSIIAWTSDEYFGVGRQLEFSTADHIGETQKMFGAVATLVNISDDGGVTVLKSRLEFSATAASTNPSVTCVHGADDMRSTSEFQVLGMNMNTVNL